MSYKICFLNNKVYIYSYFVNFNINNVTLQETGKIYKTILRQIMSKSPI